MITYGYDGLQRLIGAVESPGATYTYSYDLAGNRTDGGLTYNAANQITNAGFSYDFAGNLINDGMAAYTYDALNRTRVRGTTTYTYTGDGTLVSQLTGGVTTRYTQDLAAPLSQVLQIQVSAAARTDYLYGLNRLASLNGSIKTDRGLRRRVWSGIMLGRTTNRARRGGLPGRFFEIHHRHPDRAVGDNLCRQYCAGRSFA